MKVVIFGATGMVGQGVLRECLAEPFIESITALVRTSTGIKNPKLREIIHQDMTDLTGLDSQLTGFDACFFCLGRSVSAMSEQNYSRITYDITLAAATLLARLNPDMTFTYISGAGSNDKSRIMWARVKGRTETALLKLPLKAYMFHPGVIQPLDGIKSKTPAYRLFYNLTGPLLTIGRRLFPHAILTTEIVGRAMIAVARYGASKRILESRDIYALVKN